MNVAPYAVLCKPF